MSRQAVNQIIEKAVTDDRFFELLRNSPDQAIQGYELEATELSAFRAGAYNVVVRGMRKDREDQLALDARRTEQASPAVSQSAAVGGPQPAPARRAPVAGLVGFLIGVAIIGGGIGGFRYFQHQWPWQALGFGRPLAQASIPAASLGARPKPAASAASSGVAATSPSPVAKSATPNPSAPAQLRPSTSPAATARASAAASAAAQSLDAERAYYQAVGARLATLVKDFTATLADLRAGNDPTNNLTALSNDANDLRAHLNDAPPPDQLKRQHAALLQAVPLLQGDLDQLKSAVNQKNSDQAILIAAEMDALLNQVSDEVQFANAPHPELYQAINSSTQLSHVLNFDVLGQNVVARSNAPSNVTVRIALQAPNPSTDEVSDTLRHGVVAARQSYPQAGQVRVVGFKESNGAVGGQVGTADWYCSPDARPPDAGQLGSWQDACGKIYVTLPGASPTALPY